MKLVKKLASLLLALVMALSLSLTTILAQDIDTGKGGSATITISNAAKGTTYSVYKLFDATVTGAENGSIAYTGDIPDSLKEYFVSDIAGNISATNAAKTGDSMSEGLKAALKSWTELETVTAVATAESNGTTLNFTKLEYGYYVVTTTQGANAITVTSTNPSAEIVDKNSTNPGNLTKEADDSDVSIGDTVTYTVKFTTSNYAGTGEAAKKIASYTIKDTLPDFLSDVTVTSIVVDNDGNDQTTDDQTNITAQFDQKEITIEWYDGEKGQFKYDNGATITIIYTAKVTSPVSVGGNETSANTGNTNKVTVTWKDVEDKSYTPLEKEETIYTYAAAIQKVDENEKKLAGAKFKVKGLTVLGSKGNYKVVSYDSSDDAADGNEMETDDDGLIVIMGIASDETLVVTETSAPDGYNKLTSTFEVKPVKTSETVTTTTTYYDADGNVATEEETVITKTLVTLNNTDVVSGAKTVKNNKGSLLPTTGGMGTTIFYIVGAILVLGAGVLLVARRRMNSEK